MVRHRHSTVRSIPTSPRLQRVQHVAIVVVVLPIAGLTILVSIVLLGFSDTPVVEQWLGEEEPDEAREDDPKAHV